jgi:hypothetical protein
MNHKFNKSDENIIVNSYIYLVEYIKSLQGFKSKQININWHTLFLNYIILIAKHKLLYCLNLM